MVSMGVKHVIILFMILAFCYSTVLIGCGGVDMSSPENTVKGYLSALEDQDHKKAHKYKGDEDDIYGSIPRRPDLEFRNMTIMVTSLTDTEATVEAFWNIWVKSNEKMYPAEEMHEEFELVKWDDKWMISYERDLTE